MDHLGVQELRLAKDNVGSHSGIVFSPKEQSHVIFRKMDTMGTVTQKMSHTGHRTMGTITPVAGR